jgi:hypothetical protein
MKAQLLMRERLALSSRAFVEIAIGSWPSPYPAALTGTSTVWPTSLDNACVLRYDNETGKGDHKHVDEVEVPYQFSDLDRLQADFWADVHVRRK